MFKGKIYSLFTFAFCICNNPSILFYGSAWPHTGLKLPKRQFEKDVMLLLSSLTHDGWG
jgi:hypothetical protein